MAAPTRPGCARSVCRLQLPGSGCFSREPGSTRGVSVPPLPSPLPLPDPQQGSLPAVRIVFLASKLQRLIFCDTSNLSGKAEVHRESAPLNLAKPLQSIHNVALY